MKKRYNEAAKGRSDGFGASGNTRTKATKSMPSNSQKTTGGMQNSSGSERFEEACAKIQETTKKFLSRQPLVLDDDSEDDEAEDDLPNNSSVVDIIIKKFASEHKGDTELGRTHQFLIDAVKSGASICLICIAIVKKHEAIWNCSGCYCCFHLPCIQTWAKDSTLQQELHSAGPQSECKWFCPKCRYEYAYAHSPLKYTCFCGKVIDPEFDPWLVPHSCGQICNRVLQPICGHRCNLLCHPGPCPPCPQMVQVPCHCAGQKPQTRRCSHRSWSCGRTCNKVLSCKQHSCSAVCHAGDCPPCGKQSMQACCCCKEVMKRTCADMIWHCKQICERPLACGHHTCNNVCHSGPCEPCPRLGNRSCPCGKTSVQLPCSEDIPPCGDTCGKLLTCTIHSCSQRCHAGQCGTCSQTLMKKCRCGHKEKLFPCYKEYLCDIKCRKLRNCGRHPCNRKCCDGNCPPCEQHCGRQLGCRNHKCNSRCHSGPCYPCPLTAEIKCNCGQTVITVPCGRQKLTRPPRCNLLCKRPSVCHHSMPLPHKCHFGDCPDCHQPCRQVMACGHTCHQKCHSAVRTKIQIEQVRAGPWEPAPLPRIEILRKPCPPCHVPVPITCYGKHETQDFPCFMAKPNSCHRPCGRALTCGNHFCDKDCHLVTGAASEREAGDNCAKCEEPCPLPRPEGCVHVCQKPCHPAPCPPCSQIIRQKCHCQLNSVYVECHKWTSVKNEERLSLLCCGDRCPKLMECGHRCQSQCHCGSCVPSTSCNKKVGVRCACKRIKKEFPCHVVQQTQPTIACDDVCKEKQEQEKKMNQEMEIKQKKEETKKIMEELQWYQRKLEGKKRKPRKAKEIVNEASFWSTHKVSILIGLSVIMLAVVYGLVM